MDLLVAETNQAFADSGVIPRINLAAARATDYRSARFEGWDRNGRALSQLVDPEKTASLTTSMHGATK